MAFLIGHSLEFVSVILIFLLIYLGGKTNKQGIKKLCYNLSAVFIAFFLYSILFLHGTKPRKIITFKGEVIENYSIHDSLLGYKARQEDMLINVKKLAVDESLIYESDIHLKNGYRQSPNSNDTTSRIAIFLGGSYVFGEGLDDDETLASIFNKQGKYKIFNFGFHGYGPHHALRILETRIANEIKEDSLLGVYLVIPDHIRRAAGYSSWDQDGPSYQIEAGYLVSKGQFRPFVDPSKKSIFSKVLSLFLEKTRISKVLNLKKNKKADSHDIKRAAWIFKEMSEFFKSRNGEFVLLLDSSFEEYDKAKEFYLNLKALNLKYHKTSSWVPENDQQYYIKGDGHPTAMRNQVLADSLIELLDSSL